MERSVSDTKMTCTWHLYCSSAILSLQRFWFSLGSLLLQSPLCIMASATFMVLYGGISSRLRSGLEAMGATTVETISGLADGTMEDEWELVEEILPESSSEVHAEEWIPLTALLQAALKERGRIVRRQSLTSKTMATALGMRLHRQRQERLEDEKAQAARRIYEEAQSELKEQAKEPKWPSGAKRRRTGPRGPRARNDKEETERRRWVLKLVELVVEADLPLAQQALISVNPDMVLGAVAQGRRAATLRKRYYDWRRARRFFLTAFNDPWPRERGQVLDLIQAVIVTCCLIGFHWGCISSCGF